MFINIYTNFSASRMFRMNSQAIITGHPLQYLVYGATSLLPSIQYRFLSTSTMLNYLMKRLFHRWSCSRRFWRLSHDSKISVPTCTSNTSPRFPYAVLIASPSISYSWYRFSNIASSSLPRLRSRYRFLATSLSHRKSRTSRGAASYLMY